MCGFPGNQKPPLSVTAFVSISGGKKARSPSSPSGKVSGMDNTQCGDFLIIFADLTRRREMAAGDHPQGGDAGEPRHHDGGELSG